jgi:hypothetical protein
MADLGDSGHPANAPLAEAGPDLRAASPTGPIVFLPQNLAGVSGFPIEALTGAASRFVLAAGRGTEDLDATAGTMATPFPKAGGVPPGGADEEHTSEAARLPGPQTAGLLSVLPVDPATVDRALQRFFDELERAGAAVAWPVDDSGLCLWIVVGATGAAAMACELARRQLRRSALSNSDGGPLLVG